MSTTGVNEVFNAFVEAQKAMQRLPQAEAELSRAQGELSVTHDRLNAAFQTHDHLRDTIDGLKDSIEVQEAALRDATFREQQLRDKLEMLLGTFKSVIGEATSAVELVEPKPEPVPEETLTAGGTSPSDPTPSSDLGSTDASPNSGDGAEGVSVPSNPTLASPTFTQSESPASITGTTATSEPIAVTYTELPGKFPWNDDEHPMDKLPRLLSTFKNVVGEDTEATRESEVNPTTAPTQTANAMTNGTASLTSPSTPTGSTTPRPYWEKPSHTTWFDWRAAGNDIAPWCRQSSDDQLRSIFN